MSFLSGDFMSGDARMKSNKRITNLDMLRDHVTSW